MIKERTGSGPGHLAAELTLGLESRHSISFVRCGAPPYGALQNNRRVFEKIGYLSSVCIPTSRQRSLNPKLDRDRT